MIAQKEYLFILKNQMDGDLKKKIEEIIDR